MTEQQTPTALEQDLNVIMHKVDQAVNAARTHVEAMINLAGQVRAVLEANKVLTEVEQVQNTQKAPPVAPLSSKLPAVKASPLPPVAPPPVIPPVAPVLPVSTTTTSPMSMLFSEHSPLLALFASAEYLPMGKGRVDINTEDFKWRRDIELNESNASTSPTGFYGRSKPECVVIRLETFILMWDFALSPENALVFIADVSDVDPGRILWYRANTLPATPAKNLFDEVTAFVESYKPYQPA